CGCGATRRSRLPSRSSPLSQRRCPPLRCVRTELGGARRSARAPDSLRRDDDVRRLGTLRAFPLFERDARALGERLVAVAGDVRVMDEEILRSLIRGDEPVPLRIVEPLDGSACHENTSLTTARTGKEGTFWRKPVLALVHAR